MRTKLACLALMVMGVAVPGPAPAQTRAVYLPPVETDGMVFPVARSTWYSIINFKNDWHAPRMRLVAGRWRQVGVHQGNDIFGEPGTPVRAVLGGRVEATGWTFYSGWRVGIRGDDGRYWFYAHLQSFEPGLREGRRVRSGETIGRMGNTGYGEDPGHSDEFIHHLHIGIQEPDGRWVDPYPLMLRLYEAAVGHQR